MPGRQQVEGGDEVVDTLARLEGPEVQHVGRSRPRRLEHRPVRTRVPARRPGNGRGPRHGQRPPPGHRGERTSRSRPGGRLAHADDRRRVPHRVAGRGPEPGHLAPLVPFGVIEEGHVVHRHDARHPAIASASCSAGPWYTPIAGGAESPDDGSRGGPARTTGVPARLGGTDREDTLSRARSAPTSLRRRVGRPASGRNRRRPARALASSTTYRPAPAGRAGTALTSRATSSGPWAWPPVIGPLPPLSGHLLPERPRAPARRPPSAASAARAEPRATRSARVASSDGRGEQPVRDRGDLHGVDLERRTARARHRARHDRGPLGHRLDDGKAEAFDDRDIGAAPRPL